ncbi:MAG TPA: ABC transporter ATP-binding protein, partial [Tepidisphaeraceae bacterium]|nr:ABC transporter ATP-binding protein [Tepidisphaeraceae bacterium]
NKRSAMPVGTEFSEEHLADMAATAATATHYRILKNIGDKWPKNPVKAITCMLGVLFVMALFGSCARFFQEFLSDSCAISAVTDIRRKLYDHVIHMPLDYFTRHGTGDLTARLVTDAQGLQDGFKNVLGQSIQEPIKALFALTVAMMIDWRLTGFVIIFTPVMVIVIRKLGKKVRRTMKASLERSSAMLGQIESTLTGVRVVKSAVAEPFERRRYRAIMMKLRREQIKMARYEAWSTPLLELLGLCAVGSVLIFATWLVFEDNSFDPPQLITLMLCLVAIGEPLRRISKLNNVLQKSNAAAGRIFEIIGEPTEPRISVSNKIVVPLSFTTSINFKNLSFSYPGAIALALDNVSLEVPRGTSVAVVGRNGSGKTTLLSLLPRFFEPKSGAILIDDVDIRNWPIRRLRRMIGIVTQEAVLFPGTISQNIAYANPMATQAQIESAARRAFAHDFILQKPQGYGTMLDGLGGQLSGGQRQRINIARAILRDTPILILDEATSQVDAESEHLIQQAITELMHDRTTFVIAHRFSTILSADSIVVMEAGKIVASGKHDELLSSSDIYRQLYERQLINA